MALVPEGPSRAATVESIKATISSMEAELAATEAKLETLVGPKPKRYSAVGRMRQQTEGMGLDAGDAAPPKIKAEDILPPTGGIVNLVILLATAAAVVAATGALSGGS